MSPSLSEMLLVMAVNFLPHEVEEGDYANLKGISRISSISYTAHQLPVEFIMGAQKSASINSKTILVQGHGWRSIGHERYFSKGLQRLGNHRVTELL